MYVYKVVEGLVPVLPTDNSVKLARPKRNIKAKHFEDCITSNIVEKRTCNNTKGLELQVRLQETAVPKFFLCEHRNSLEPSVKQCRACKFLRSI
jgi:hypothetical protein